jgi:hypothetical protein
MIRNILFLLLSFCVIHSGIAIAQSVGNINEMVSENHGIIRESFFSGTNSGIVVHIQDLHCNYDAQLSIYNILNELMGKYRIGLVAIEGCVGRLETSPYAKQPNDSIKESTAKYMLKAGRIDGAGYAHMMRHGDFLFLGADDEALHQDNVDAYVKSLEAEADNVRFYDNIKSILDSIKAKAYTSALKEFDEKISAYKDETLDFSQYVLYLDGLYRERGYDPDAYPVFMKLVLVVEKESGIDFLKVDDERAQCIEKLSQTLEPRPLSELLDKSLHFKTGALSPRLIYNYLSDMAAGQKSVDLKNDYPQLALYIDYINLYSDIDNTALFKEIAALENAVKESLFTDDAQRKIDRMYHNLLILRDMFSLKVTVNDIQYYRANRKEFVPAYIINFITDIAKRYSVLYELDPAFRDIAARLPDMERFYNIAEERDAVLVKNTVDAMKNNNADIAVLISGGFHTDGITKLLKERGISYIVVTPNIESLGPPGLYRSILLGAKSGLEEFIQRAEEYARHYKENIQKRSLS